MPLISTALSDCCGRSETLRQNPNRSHAKRIRDDSLFETGFSLATIANTGCQYWQSFLWKCSFKCRTDSSKCRIINLSYPPHSLARFSLTGFWITSIDLGNRDSPRQHRSGPQPCQSGWGLLPWGDLLSSSRKTIIQFCQFKRISRSKSKIGETKNRLYSSCLANLRKSCGQYCIAKHEN